MFESGVEMMIDPLLSNFRDLGLKVAFPAIRIKETPTETTYKLCEEAGTDLGQLLTAKATSSRLNHSIQTWKSPGRISGGLYIITAKKMYQCHARFLGVSSQFPTTGIDNCCRQRPCD